MTTPEDDPLKKVPRTKALVDKHEKLMSAITPQTPRQDVLKLLHDVMTELAVHAMRLEIELGEANARLAQHKPKD